MCSLTRLCHVSLNDVIPPVGARQFSAAVTAHTKQPLSDASNFSRPLIPLRFTDKQRPVQRDSNLATHLTALFPSSCPGRWLILAVSWLKLQPFWIFTEKTGSRVALWGAVQAGRRLRFSTSRQPCFSADGDTTSRQ